MAAASARHVWVADGDIHRGQRATAYWTTSAQTRRQPLQRTTGFVALMCRRKALALQRATGFVTSAWAADVEWRHRTNVSTNGRHRTDGPSTGREAARPYEHSEYGSGYDAVQLQPARTHGIPAFHTVRSFHPGHASSALPYPLCLEQARQTTDNAYNRAYIGAYVDRGAPRVGCDMMA